MGFRPVQQIISGMLRRRMIRQHARWLSAALQGRKVAPRIPTRRVDEGGFARLMSTERGRRAASEWWYDAIDRTSR